MSEENVKVNEELSGSEQEGAFVEASLSSLYAGMVTTNDIYSANKDLLLIRAGVMLDERKIDAIHRHNAYQDTIHIAYGSKYEMLERALSCKIVIQKELEESSGYNDIKEKAGEIIDALDDMDEIENDRAAEVSDELSQRLENTSQEVVINLINSLGPVDEYLPRHCVEVGMLSGLLSRWLGFSKEAVDRMVMLGLLHDCGKASIPKEILGAPRKLSIAEFEVVKMHSVYSHDKLLSVERDVQNAAKYHHERIDGLGYPDGLRGTEIPLEAKIVSVCDIYDAIVSRRSYKEPQSPFNVMKQLHNMRGTALDGELVDVFTSNILGELLDKPVLLSNGEVGVVCELDDKDMEHPFVRTVKEIVKTNKLLYITSMYYG